VQAGLKFRSPVVTTRDGLEWFNSLPEERRNKPRAGLPPEREAELLSLWAKAQQGG
jgi:2'-hydroxyisoflavone reductase